ncbi:MAG: hypothetical protein LBS96_09895 [Oscillospiraceae bacterium]|jgi:hypothetical protein|nr:hypothetical protein [Oscillospiraceae bacterium]
MEWISTGVGRVVLAAALAALVAFLGFLGKKIFDSKKAAGNVNSVYIGGDNLGTIKNKNVTKNQKFGGLLAVVLLIIVLPLNIVSWHGGGIPNGTYKPIGENAAYTYDLIIEGDQFTLGGYFPITHKYKLKNGVITLGNDNGSIGLPYVYDKKTKHIAMEIEGTGVKIEWERTK